MLGAIIGDIVGSRFEFHNHKSKRYELFHKDCKYTDDSVMTLAVGLAIVQSKNDIEVLSSYAVECMRVLGRAYPDSGYGGKFRWWLRRENPYPYKSYGNGAAMRVSACGFMGRSLEEVKLLANAVTKVTHNHPEALKGAEATAVAIYLAKTGKSKEEIKQYVVNHYYGINFTLDEIRDSYGFLVSCQETVPPAMQAFFESTDFEDAIRNATSIGGDSDTIAAITGAIAEAYYGIPNDLRQQAVAYLDNNLKAILEQCEIYASDKD